MRLPVRTLELAAYKLKTKANDFMRKSFTFKDAKRSEIWRKKSVDAEFQAEELLWFAIKHAEYNKKYNL